MKYNIEREDYKILVNGTWIDNGVEMAKHFYGENLWVEEFNNGEIIWCGDESTPIRDCFYVKDGIKVSDIVKALCYTYNKPDEEYDPVLDEGRSAVAFYAEQSVYNEFDGNMIIQFPEFIDALDNIKPIGDFEKDHPNFKYDVYKEIYKAVETFEKLSSN